MNIEELNSIEDHHKQIKKHEELIDQLQHNKNEMKKEAIGQIEYYCKNEKNEC